MRPKNPNCSKNKLSFVLKEEKKVIKRKNNEKRQRMGKYILYRIVSYHIREWEWVKK